MPTLKEKAQSLLDAGATPEQVRAGFEKKYGIDLKSVPADTEMSRIPIVVQQLKDRDRRVTIGPAGMPMAADLEMDPRVERVVDGIESVASGAGQLLVGPAAAVHGLGKGLTAQVMRLHNAAMPAIEAVTGNKGLAYSEEDMASPFLSIGEKLGYNVEVPAVTDPQKQVPASIAQQYSGIIEVLENRSRDPVLDQIGADLNDNIAGLAQLIATTAGFTTETVGDSFEATSNMFSQLPSAIVGGTAGSLDALRQLGFDGVTTQPATLLMTVLPAARALRGNPAAMRILRSNPQAAKALDALNRLDDHVKHTRVGEAVHKVSQHPIYQKVIRDAKLGAVVGAVSQVALELDLSPLAAATSGALLGGATGRVLAGALALKPWMRAAAAQNFADRFASDDVDVTEALRFAVERAEQARTTTESAAQRSGGLGRRRETGVGTEGEAPPSPREMADVRDDFARDRRKIEKADPLGQRGVATVDLDPAVRAAERRDLTRALDSLEGDDATTVALREGLEKRLRALDEVDDAEAFVKEQLDDPAVQADIYERVGDAYDAAMRAGDEEYAAKLDELYQAIDAKQPRKVARMVWDDDVGQFIRDETPELLGSTPITLEDAAYLGDPAASWRRRTVAERAKRELIDSGDYVVIKGGPRHDMTVLADGSVKFRSAGTKGINRLRKIKDLDPTLREELVKVHESMPGSRDLSTSMGVVLDVLHDDSLSMLYSGEARRSFAGYLAKRLDLADDAEARFVENMAGDDGVLMGLARGALGSGDLPGDMALHYTDAKGVARTARLGTRDGRLGLATEWKWKQLSKDPKKMREMLADAMHTALHQQAINKGYIGLAEGVRRAHQVGSGGRRVVNLEPGLDPEMLPEGFATPQQAFERTLIRAMKGESLPPTIELDAPTFAIDEMGGLTRSEATTPPLSLAQLMDDYSGKRNLPASFADAMVENGLTLDDIGPAMQRIRDRFLETPAADLDWMDFIADRAKGVPKQPKPKVVALHRDWRRSMGVQMNVLEAMQDVMSLGQNLNRMAKIGLTGRSSAGHVRNHLQGAFSTAIREGRSLPSVWGRFIESSKMLYDWQTGKITKDDPRWALINELSKTNLFTGNPITAEIGTIEAQRGTMNKFRGIVGIAAEDKMRSGAGLFGLRKAGIGAANVLAWGFEKALQAYQLNDDLWKFDTAYHAADSLLRDARQLLDHEYIEAWTGRDGWVEVGRRDVEKLPIIAKAAAEYANELHFNYVDVPLYVQKLRKAPLVGAASPFVTWAYKAVDMPAKPGLMSAVYGSTAGIPFRSNSAALLKRQVKSALALGARRFITQATLRQTLDEDRDFLSRIATYGGTTAAPALWAGNDPRYREMVPLQSLSLSEGSLTLAKTGLLGIYGIVNAVDKDISNQPRAKGDKRKLLRTTDRIRAGKFISPREMLDLVGLGGGFFNDLYRDLTDPKYGTEASVDEIFARHAINATAYLFGGTIADTGALAKALLDPTSQMTSYGRRASTGMIRESIAGWYAREMIGLGMARMDISKITAKDLGRVKSSLVKQRLSPLRKEYKAAAEQLRAAEERGDAVQVRALAAKQAELRETMQAAGDEIGEIMEPYIEWVQTRQAELED